MIVERAFGPSDADKNKEKLFYESVSAFRMSRNVESLAK
jgi:hypothetical protein